MKFLVLIFFMVSWATAQYVDSFANVDGTVLHDHDGAWDYSFGDNTGMRIYNNSIRLEGYFENETRFYSSSNSDTSTVDVLNFAPWCVMGPTIRTTASQRGYAAFFSVNIRNGGSVTRNGLYFFGFPNDGGDTSTIYTLSIRLLPPDTIAVFVNNVRVAAQQDPDLLPSGSPGLYCNNSIGTPSIILDNWSDGRSGGPPVVDTCIVVGTQSSNGKVHVITNTTIKVACIGNSLTEGTNLSDPDSAYPVVLQSLLGSKYAVNNYGQSGHTLLRNGDAPWYEHIASTIALKPDIAIIELGTNDTKSENWVYESEFITDYEWLIDTIRSSNPRVKIYICIPPPAFSGAYGINDSLMQIYNSRLPTIAANKNVTIVDNRSIFTGLSVLFSDGIHPNGIGYDTLARNIYKSIYPNNFNRGVCTDTVKIVSIPDANCSFVNWTIEHGSADTVSSGDTLKVVPTDSVVIKGNFTGLKPIITNITGSISNGSGITISGINFGIKTQPKPLVWADFATDINPTSLGVRTSWDENQYMQYTSNAPAGAGTTRASYGEWNSANNPTRSFSFCIRVSNPNYYQRVYTFGKRYYDFPTTTNQKVWRINPETGCNLPICGDPVMAYGNNEWFAHLNECDSENPDRFTNNGGYTAYTEDQWATEEVIWQFEGGSGRYLNNEVAAGNGIWAYWRNGSLIFRQESINNCANQYTDLRLFDDFTASNNITDTPPVGSKVYKTYLYADTVFNRVIIGNGRTLELSNNRMIIVPTAWSNNSITGRVTLGTLSVGDSAWIYAYNENDSVSSGFGVVVRSSGYGSTSKSRKSGNRQSNMGMGMH